MDEQSEQPTQQQQQQHSGTTTFVNQSSTTAIQSQPHDDDAWWWEVENGDLILDLVPNIDAASHSESENVNNNNSNHTSELSTDFVALLKSGETVNVTLLANNTNTSDGSADSAIVENIAEATASLHKQLTEKTQADIVLEVENNDATTYNSPDYSHDPTIAPSQAAAREQTLEEFKEELRIKRLTRQTAVQDLRDEIATLRRQLAEEQELTRRLRRNNAVEVSSTDVEPSSVDEEGAIGGTTNAEPDSDDEDPQSRGRHANIELANAQLALQMANAENLSLRTEMGVVQKQVGTLKEVIACCKQMLNVKEEQCVQLKTKLDEIETAFGERELKIMSSNLRQEYERQLGNIRQLRQLYEERQRIALAEQENLQRLISIKRDELAAEQQKTKNFEEHNQTLMKEIESANIELATLREECNEHKFEKKALKEEMGTVNTLFSQMVMGFNGENNLDIDRLTTMLEENRGLLNDMATKEANCTDGATLPKLLFELVEEAGMGGKSTECNRSPTPTSIVNSSADEEDYKLHRDTPDRGECRNLESEELVSAEPAAVAADHNNTNCKTENAAVTCATATANATAGACCGRRHHRKSAGNRMKLPTATAATDCTAMSATALRTHEPEVMSKVATTQEIIGNLPKVWKVLMELLSHHKIERVQFEEHGASEDCYKSVETANGPKAELSVSKTYIKLKDLILEKKSLVKDTNRLKTLNCHLEYRLNEQEKRLSAVSLELTKTWHLVGKMQRQHRQLHTQEQILRYQLQQKRRLLTELKDELEFCRRKWAAARAKNDESQEQWNDLRREFALRKLEHANNSAESGYSDSGQASDEEIVVAAPTNLTSDMETTTSNGAGGGGGVGGCAGGVGGAAAACRRKRLKEMFEHSRKIKRMQSTSPGRAGDGSAEIVLRWNSAPPTCGWRDSSEANHGVVDIYGDEDNNASGGDGEFAGAVDLTGVTATSRGAIPKNIVARNRHHSRRDDMAMETATDVVDADDSRGERAERIQRLEEQCKSLIQRVLETSDNRERLEVQLRSFQDEIAPVQYAVPLNDLFKKKRIERMTRASSVPVTGTLTPREEEYTRKRSERLGRLEEESRQLLSRIKRTSDRGHYLRCSLDRLRRGPSREGSFESNTEEESIKTEEKPSSSKLNMLKEDKQTDDMITKDQDTNEVAASEPQVNLNPLTANEEAYTARRSARLQRLENESKELLNRLSRNNERGQQLGNKLDALHEHHSDVLTNGVDAAPSNTTLPPTTPKVSIEQRLGNIEQISSNRMERLRILEEEGKELLNRLAGTSARGTEMINRIAAREQNRQTTAIETSDSEIPVTTTADKVTDPEDECTAGMEATAVASVLPTLNNVACSSIVSEELTDRVTVTTIPSQIAAQQGAIPKQPRTKPTGLVLNAALRAKAANNKEPKQKQNNQTDGESLEDMVRRLQQTPYPEEQNVLQEKGDKLEEIEKKDVDENCEVGTEKVNPNTSDTTE
uniref:Coiled-coil domain-containing protein 14 n=1 Tax=Zeugodacus cucurbitae TaxID=28588 RepID=A0A0A1WJC6_ZEUCU